MIYFGKLSNTQTKTFVDAELKDFATTYPNIDLFTVDHNEINSVADQIENDRVIIYYADCPPYDGLNVFFNLFNRYPNKKFCILTDQPGWKDIAQWPVNVQWIWYNFNVIGYDSNNIVDDYRNIDCFTNKNFDSKKIGISLNRLPRSHRLCLLSYMLGVGLDQDCVITAPLLTWHLQTNNTLDIMDVVPWDFSSHNNFKNDMLTGWKRAKLTDGIAPTGNLDPDKRHPSIFEPYHGSEPGNFNNYQNNLLPLFYKNSFVEFINFSVYDYSLPWICEKILHSQLSCNFPIFVAGKGTVEWLRTHEFDVFDDIINHAYDLEVDPVLRMQKLINDNRDLLQHQKHTKDLWIKHQPRFRDNVEWFIKNSDKSVATGKKLLNQWLTNSVSDVTISTLQLETKEKLWD